MVDLFGHPYDDGRTASNGTSVPDDASDATPTDDRNSRVKDRYLEEKTIRFRFVPSRDNASAVSPRVIHAHWLKTVQDEFGDKVKVYDNHNRLVPKIDLLRWSDLQHQQHFTVHQSTPKATSNPTHDNRNTTAPRYHSPSGGNARFIIHRIQTDIPLKELKAIPKIINLLKDNSCYMNHHKWPEDVWNTTQLGFMADLDPQFYTDEQATMKVSQQIQKVLPKVKVPAFRLVYCAPKVRGSNYYVTTKAYAIETEKVHGHTLTDIFMKAYRESLAFVPFQMRNKNPKAFTNAIYRQNESIANHHTIILHNLGVDAMYYLSDRIRALDGVLDITPAKTVTINGNFRLLVQKQSFRKLRKQLISALPEWYDTCVPTDARPSEDAYPGPPCVAPLSEDGYSSGEDSYMNLSINTALSYEGSVLSDTESYNNLSSVSSRHSPPTGFNRQPPHVHGFNWSTRSYENTMLPTSTATAASNRQEEFSPPPSDTISELESSRAEIEELRSRITELTTAFATEKTELRVSFEKEKQDMIQLMKDEMRATFREQMQHFPQPSAPPVPPPPTSIGPSLMDQLKEMFALQEQKYYTTLTTMVASMTVSPSLPPTVKRTSEQIETSHNDSPKKASTDKRQNVSSTPQKKLQTPEAIDVTASPSPDSGHKEMDLTDDSHLGGGNQASSSKFEDGTPPRNQHD